MPLVKRQVLFFLLVVFLCSVTTLAKENWLRIESTNFQLAGNVSEKELKDVAGKLEQFHTSFQKSFNKFQFKTPFSTKVIVFQNNPKPIFISADDANYISISPNNDFADVFHGYADFLINNNLGQGKIPAWINHGLAEYFANRNGTKELLISQQNNLSSLQILLETNEFTLQSQTDERKAIFNAQSLAFVCFLLKEGKFETIEKLIELLQKGKESREALILAFQFDYKKSENEFQQFLKQPKLMTNNGLTSFNVDFQVSQISEAKSLAIQGEFLFYANRLKEATDILEKSLRLEPNSGFAFSTLALVKVKQNYFDEAEELAEKAIKNEPDNFLNHYRYAAVLSKQGMTEFGFVSGYHPILAEKMRVALKKAIQLNPAFAESYSLLAFINYVRNEQIDESLLLIQKALETAPTNQRYLLRRAELNLRKEQFVEARRDAYEVFRYAPNESVKLYAQNTIQRIDSTEYQLNRIRNDKERYVNQDIVTEQPLSEEEIKQLREKAVADQIRLVLRRPNEKEKRVIASLTRIECGKERMIFNFKTATGSLRLQAKSFEDVNLLSFIEGMNGFRLFCGDVKRENFASVIYGGESKTDNLISIEFVPKGFKLQETLVVKLQEK